MDLANIKPTERTVEIEHPATGQPLGLRLTLVSLDDDRLKRTKRSITDETLKLQAKGKSLKVEELERNSKALLWGATTGWEWYNPTGKEGDAGFDPNEQAEWEGDPNPEFNQRNFYAVLDHPNFGPIVSEQIREVLEDTRGFFAPSKTT